MVGEWNKALALFLEKATPGIHESRYIKNAGRCVARHLREKFKYAIEIKIDLESRL